MKKLLTQFNAMRGHSGGYSLMETVMYIALFVLLSVVLVSALYGMVSAYSAIRANDDLLDSAHVSMERMSREVRNAVSIDTLTSTFSSNPGILTLNALDGAGSPKTVKFDISGTKSLQMLDSTDGTSRDLTGSQVEVTSLIFRNVTTSIGSAVKVEVSFKSIRGTSTRTVSLSDTIMLRGSY